MTPRLQQSIRLLQMGSLELEAFVESQLEENPLLKRGEADGEAAAAASGGPEFPAGTTGEGIPAAEAFAAPRAAAGFDGDLPGPEERVAAAPSLRDRLERQLMLDIADPRDRLIGRALIDALDPSGWLTADLEGFARGLGALPDDVERVLLSLQQFEPAGLFARSLAECLALQLRDRGRYGPAMAALLDNLDLLAAGRFDALARACGVDGDELAGMVRELRSLDPKPASAFDEDAAAMPVVPDILVRAHAGGGWAVELNDEALPRVLVDREYYARVRGDAASDADREFIADRLSSANWLVKALHQRAETMLKVAAELVRRQQDFFARGVRHLRPLTLRDIADSGGTPREHGEPRDRQQDDGHAARPLRTQIFLYRRHSGDGRRRGPFGRSGPAPAQGADRRRRPRQDAFGRQAGGRNARRGHRDCAPHGRQIPGDNGHSVLRAAPPAQFGGRLLEKAIDRGRSALVNVPKNRPVRRQVGAAGADFRKR